MEDTGVLSEELHGFGLRTTDSNVLQKLFQLGLKWDVDEASLVEKYVAFQRNAKLPDLVEQKHVDLFDREISARLESSRHRTPKNIPTALPKVNILPQKMLEELMATESQNEQQNLFSSYIPNSTVPKFQLPGTLRTSNKENISLEANANNEPICTYLSSAGSTETFSANERVPSAEWTISDIDPFHAPVRYMHQPTLEKAEILDNWTWELIKRAMNNLPDESLITPNPDPISDSQPSGRVNPNGLFIRTPIKMSSSQAVYSKPEPMDRVTLLRPTCVRLQSPHLVGGRIAAQISTVSATQLADKTNGNFGSYSELAKQRLQSNNVGLVGLRQVSGVQSSMEGVTRLEFPLSDRSISFSLYAGQPVVVRASNPTGQLLCVTDLFSAPIVPPPEYSPPKNALNVMVACGPYTLSESNDPSLLLTLLRAVKKNRPHILIMIGPFVDCQHSAVQAYHDSTYEELFHTRINSVAEYCSHLDVHLVIVPSWREVHHDPVYPTPPFDQSWTQQTPELISAYRNAHFFWDPCLFRIGDYVFGVTSVDVPFHLSCEEISSNCSGDRISRLCQHLLSSGSFYPIHPPSDDLPLDYPLWNRRAQMPVTPHCLIVPSRLRQFVKDVKGVLCINPGHVSRGQSSGSYAVLTIHKEPLDVAGETDPKQQISTPLSIARRATVAVMRV